MSLQKHDAYISINSATHIVFDEEKLKKKYSSKLDIIGNLGAQYSKRNTRQLSNSSDGSIDGKLDWKLMIETIDNDDDSSLLKFLDLIRQRVVNLADEKGFTLLHYAVLKLRPEKIVLLLNYARVKQKEPEDVIKEWINQKTFKDKFTPLHFACFKGGGDMINLLIDNGANIHDENEYGLSMLHVAAQGDSSIALYIFKLKGLNINKQDIRGSTPLHWACYSQSEVALTYLLSMKPQLDVQDQDGYTPMHLAIKSVESSQSTRPVRYLLIKGARPDIKDNQGKLPIDHVKDIRNRDLQIDLERILHEQKGLECLMLKTPMRKISKSKNTILIFSFSFFCIFALKFYFIFIRLDYMLVILNLVLTLLTLFFFVVCVQKDPGYLKSDMDFYKLLLQFDPTQLCPDCKTIRTSRSRHCSICGKCVERFDHHCPWINNCVGIDNHNYFILYIIFQHLVLVFTFVASIYALSTTYDGEDKDKNILYFSEQQYSGALHYVFISIILISTSFFLFPLTILCYVQLTNYFKGITSNERFANHKVQEPVSIRSSQVSYISSKNVSESLNGKGRRTLRNLRNVADDQDPLVELKLQSNKKKNSVDCAQTYRNCLMMCNTKARDTQEQLYDEQKKENEQYAKSRKSQISTI